MKLLAKLLILPLVGLLLSGCGLMTPSDYSEDSISVYTPRTSSHAPSSSSEKSPNAQPSASPAIPSSNPYSSTADYYWMPYWASLPFFAYEKSPTDDYDAYLGKWEKGAAYVWEFNSDREEKITFAVMARMSYDGHAEKTLFVDHTTMNQNDTFEQNADNDGTPRLTVDLNGWEQPPTNHERYDCFLNTSEWRPLPLLEYVWINKGYNRIAI